ncbi:MAG: cytochrome-c oxidase, cbb3-type subunit II [Woeseia sp.]|jgi:cytochrome c oxidase cbb3-type subunit II|nr:cytochrome-c oxidase, cbb3-type subunit II [Woeseia sp.]
MNGLELHKKLEHNIGLLVFGILFVSAIGGLVQVLPSLFQKSLQVPAENTRVYSALELLGRDIYIREGCSTCHSQQIRPLVGEVERYGSYSRAGEFVYDRPFLWGSKRTGPDLHRVGGKYSNAWHEVHLLNPRAVVPESIMPAYPWLEHRAANAAGDIEKRLSGLRRLGHPYSDDDIENAEASVANASELDAMVAYLQVLGTAYPPGSER